MAPQLGLTAEKKLLFILHNLGSRIVAMCLTESTNPANQERVVKYLTRGIPPGMIFMIERVYEIAGILHHNGAGLPWSETKQWFLTINDGLGETVPARAIRSMTWDVTKRTAWKAVTNHMDRKCPSCYEVKVDNLLTVLETPYGDFLYCPVLACGYVRR